MISYVIAAPPAQTSGLDADMNGLISRSDMYITHITYLSIYLSLYIYIYIYIHTHLSLYIYIYIYIIIYV